MAFAPAFMFRHLFFLAGAALFLGMLFTLQALVLEVDVVAPASVGAAHVREVAALEGVHRGQWKARLPAPDQLAERLAQRLPEAAWVGVRFLGTHCEIRVVGRTLREPLARLAPRHIVATHDAVVTAIHADKGMPMVRPNDHVLRGQILISGLVGDETHNQRVAATGTVRGLVWYTQSIAVPLTTRARVLTGRHTDQRYIRIFGYTLKYKGYRQSVIQRPLIRHTTHHPTLFGYRLPWTFISQRKWEVGTTVTTITRQQARLKALRQGAQELLEELGKDAVLTRQNLLHETVRGGKVYINIHVEVDQAIAKETDLIDRPIDR
jgi:similar to stage IV sporulation protein